MYGLDVGHNARHHDQVARSLLAAAAEEFTARGSQASMADVARRAGVSRATLYNYFTTRDELVDALTLTAIDAADRRLGEIDVDRLGVGQALEQLSIALVSCGAQFAVTVSPLRDGSRSAGAQLIRPRLVAIFERGIADGSLSRDYSLELLLTMYYGLLMGALLAERESSESPTGLGVAVARLFLHGAGASPQASAEHR
jgi:AcrR family transcriptional regulator